MAVSVDMPEESDSPDDLFLRVAGQRDGEEVATQKSRRAGPRTLRCKYTSRTINARLNARTLAFSGSVK